jgi:hypothetical protein
MKSGRTILGILLFFALGLPLLSGIQSLKAVRVAQAPKVDGDLSDEVWKSAEPFTGFRMVEPRPNQDPTERTELRVLFDESNLYFGVRCFDGEPSRIAANSMAHDGSDEHSENDDIIRVLLDPFQDKRNAYIFFVNPRGARSEGLASGEHYSLNWDGIWEARARIVAEGWTAELQIPFKTISFKPGLTAWGINVERYIPRKLETIRLSGTNRDNFFYNPVEAAALEGIQEVKQGKGFTFRPYGLASILKDHVMGGGYGSKLDGGFDIYKNFTPNLVGAFSYNTDFAETEVDDRQINLTRFALYFPEKRMFFLEGSDIFSFASSESFSPFFSRRIGLVNGRQAPITFGAKVYGKIGDTNLAVLDVRTDSFGEFAGRNFFAARMSQNILEESKIGWIFTNGSPTGEKNSLAGADFTYQTSRFAGNQNFIASGWYAYNWNERKQGRHQGYGFRLDYPNDLWDIGTSYAYYGDSLDPGLGFVPRNRIQTAYGRISFQPRPEKGFLGRFVRQFFFEFSGDYYWDLAGNLETRKLFMAPLNLETQGGEHIEFNINPNRDVLPYDFELSEGVVLPAGPYDFTNYNIEFNTAGYRPVAAALEWRFGNFYSGRYDDAELGLSLKYKGYATVSLNANFVRGRLPQGNFNENVYQIKADLFLSPDLGLMNYVQYDDVSRELGWSMRLRWRISPGNEIFIVYNKNWEKRWDPASRFFPLEERGVLKISFSIRP